MAQSAAQTTTKPTKKSYVRTPRTILLGPSLPARHGHQPAVQLAANAKRLEIIKRKREPDPLPALLALTKPSKP